MVGPREVGDSAVHFGVGIPSAFSAELPDAPVCTVLAVKESDELVSRVSVRFLRVCRGGARRDDNCGALLYADAQISTARATGHTVVRYVAEVEACFRMLGPRTSHYLTQDGGLGRLVSMVALAEEGGLFTISAGVDLSRKLMEGGGLKILPIGGLLEVK